MSTDTDAPTVNDPTLQPLLRERQFWAAVLLGLPALVLAYVLAVRLAVMAATGSVGDVVAEATGTLLAVGAMLAANPITLYLTARQYARGKAAEAVGVQLAGMGVPQPMTAAGVELTDDDLDELERRHAGTDGGSLVDPGSYQETNIQPKVYDQGERTP